MGIRTEQSTQTDGERLPDLDTEATGDDLVDHLINAADELGVTVRIVPEAEWTHGEGKCICEQLSFITRDGVAVAGQYTVHPSLWFRYSS